MLVGVLMVMRKERVLDVTESAEPEIVLFEAVRTGVSRHAFLVNWAVHFRFLD